MSINLVYNSPRYSIVEYPKHGAYEILNKDVGLIGFITGSVALRFRKELEEAFDSQYTLDGSKYFVVEYPKSEAYEILNKDVGLVGFVTGNVALLFRREMEDTFDSQNALENSEELLENLLLSFDVFMSLPAVVH